MYTDKHHVHPVGPQLWLTMTHILFSQKGWVFFFIYILLCLIFCPPPQLNQLATLSCRHQ